MMPIIIPTDKWTLEIVKSLLKHNVSNVAILAVIDTIDKINEAEEQATATALVGGNIQIPAEDGYIHLKGLGQR